MLQRSDKSEVRGTGKGEEITDDTLMVITYRSDETDHIIKP